MIDTAVANIISPAVTAKYPDTLLGEHITIGLDIGEQVITSRFFFQQQANLITGFFTAVAIVHIGQPGFHRFFHLR